MNGCRVFAKIGPTSKLIGEHEAYKKMGAALDLPIPDYVGLFTRQGMSALLTSDCGQNMEKEVWTPGLM